MLGPQSRAASVQGQGGSVQRDGFSPASAPCQRTFTEGVAHETGATAAVAWLASALDGVADLFAVGGVPPQRAAQPIARPSLSARVALAASGSWQGSNAQDGEGAVGSKHVLGDGVDTV
jgi:hypothetical protein